jgi:glutathione S-transferase
VDATSQAHPTLWHLPVSHYSEKVRWALDHKRVPHRRRAMPAPGLHMPASFILTGGESQTFPVLQIDGRAIGDSTEIIAALEQRYPERPLYPEDPEQRRRALELEDFFDDELGPHTRLLVFHELGNDPQSFQAALARSAPPALARLGAGAVAYGRAYTGLRFGVRDEQSADLARVKIVAAFDKLEDELGSGEYLVGESFSVADLSAAALFYPFVLPKGGPMPHDLPVPAGLKSFRAPLEGRAGYEWVETTYERHRARARPAGRAAAATA